MEVDIYRAKKSPGRHENLYVFVPAGSKPENLPLEIIEKTGGLIFEKSINMKPNEKRIAIDTNEALKNLDEMGYHEQSSKIEFEIRVGGAKVSA